MESNNRTFEFSGTRQVLFEAAAELFAHRPYESVTAEDIAAHVGVDVSEFHKNFPSKESVLLALYEYFRLNCIAERPSLEELEPTLREGSVLEIVNCVVYVFSDSSFTLMLNAYRIVVSRMFVDERARALAEEYVVRGSIDYVDKVFKRAIQLGRFPQFDTRALAQFCNSTTMFVFVSYSLDSSPEYLTELQRHQLALNEHCANYLAQLSQPPRLRQNPLSSPDRTRPPRGRH